MGPTAAVAAPTTAEATTTTTRSPTSPAPAPARRGVRRYSRPTRWYHTVFYVTTLVLLGTGWWLRRGGEGKPSWLSDLLDLPDTEIHRRAGWVLVAVAAAGLTLGVRAAWTFARETLRVDRGDGRWFARWPVGVLTGRFARHEGHFDPGQRLANLVFVGSLATLIGSGIALDLLSGGETFATMVKVHRYATYVLTVTVIGHILLALGWLPGYRGAWRSMHAGGRVPLATARRLWPASAERAEREEQAEDQPAASPSGSGSTPPVATPSGDRTD